MGIRPVANSVTVVAKCSRCMGTMREREDKGAFSKAPFGRLWIYECDGCGRRKTFVSQTSPIEAAAEQFGERAVAGVR